MTILSVTFAPEIVDKQPHALDGPTQLTLRFDPTSTETYSLYLGGEVQPVEITAGEISRLAAKAFFKLEGKDGNTCIEDVTISKEGGALKATLTTRQRAYCFGTITVHPRVAGLTHLDMRQYQSRILDSKNQ